MRLLDFWLIKIDHLSSRRLVSRGFFSKKPCFKWTLPQKTTINKSTPNSFYINSSSIETLSKSHHKLQKNFKISKVEIPLDSNLKTPNEFYIKIFKYKKHLNKIHSNNFFFKLQSFIGIELHNLQKIQEL